MQNNIDKLIKGCLEGDQKAQMHLYDSYCDAMYNIACRYLKNEEDAKDAMQEGFIKAFLKIESYKNEFSFGVWLKRIIINQCIDVLKKRKLKFDSIQTDNLQLIDDDNWEVNTAISKSQIISAIDQLAEKYMLVVKLYLLDGYNKEEISQILNIPIKPPRTHLRRGRLQLQNLLNNKRYETGY